MTKEQAGVVKKVVDEITGKNYTKTFSGKSGTLHIRIGTYVDNTKEQEKTWIDEKENERVQIISKLMEHFKEFEISKNNKRYQGFINDICITVK